MHYTIVLTPPPTQASRYVETSQALYTHYQPSYLLTEDRSSAPHITVVQFDCDSPEQAKMVWSYVCDKMEEEQIEPFEPPFTGISFIEGTGPYKGSTWVELSIQRGNQNAPIMKIHNITLKALEAFHLKPLNASGNDYRPHLTLARIVMPKEMKTWTKALFENPGFFNLEFGLSDEKWQYAHTLAAFSAQTKNS